jgi:hypothetical protein
MPVKPGASERSLTGETWVAVVAAGGLLITVKSTAAAITAATAARASRYRVTWLQRHCNGSVLRNHDEPGPVC